LPCEAEALKLMEQLSAITEEEQRILDGRAGVNRDLYMDAEQDVINSHKLLKEGRIISIRKHTRFVHFPEHTHDYIEMIYMLSGQTTHYVNGKKIKLGQGEILIMNQHARQEILPAGEGDIGINFIILPEFFDTAMQFLDSEDSPIRRFLLSCIRGENDEIGYLHFKVASILPIQNLMVNMIWLLVNEPHGRRRILQNTMSLLIMHLANHTEALSLKTKDEQRKFQILSYIDEHYQNGSLEELAGLLHYDVSALSREIKKLMGKNYTELVQDKRLSQAQFLLSTTKMSIEEVGIRTGYENTSYFYRIFKKAYGITPREFRKQN